MTVLRSKWKVIGLLLRLVFRIAVRRSLAFPVVMVREANECRVEPDGNE